MWMNEIAAIGHGIKKIENISPPSLLKEVAVMGLRTLEGISLNDTKHVLDLDKTNELVKQGFLSYGKDSSRLMPTSKGLQVMDHILAAIIK